MPTDDRMWELGTRQGEILARLDNLEKAVRRSHERIDDVNETLQELAKRDERQEQHLAALQEAIAEFHDTIGDVKGALKTLRRTIGGAVILVMAFGGLVGALGVEIMPILVKHVLALVGM